MRAIETALQANTNCRLNSLMVERPLSRDGTIELRRRRRRRTGSGVGIWRSDTAPGVLAGDTK
jgi:hypothetical protein